MISQATQEYRSLFISLISQISEIERKGNELFDKIEKASWTGYDCTMAQHDYEQLLASLQGLEAQARSSGLLSICSAPASDAQPPRDLASRTSEAAEAIKHFDAEKTRLIANLQAAVSAASLKGTHS